MTSRAPTAEQVQSLDEFLLYAARIVPELRERSDEEKRAAWARTLAAATRVGLSETEARAIIAEVQSHLPQRDEGDER